MEQEESPEREQRGTEPYNKELVAVASFESPVEAQMAKGMLESAGIACELTGEHANQLIQSAFGVRLEVGPQDEAAARQLLDQAGEKTGTPELQPGEEPGFEIEQGGPDGET
jgi:hypothetical protein